MITGDQIQAVNGHNVLSSTYTEVLKCVQNSGKSVELLLSQMSNGRKAIAAANNKTAPKIKITDSTGECLRSLGIAVLGLVSSLVGRYSSFGYCLLFGLDSVCSN